MTFVVLVAILFVSALVDVAIGALASGERAKSFAAISPGMLPPLAVVFALLVGFLAAQVWSDFDRANAAVNREASSLRAVVLLADAFPGDTGERLRALVRQHIEDAVQREWPAMAKGDASLALMPASLTAALRATLALEPHASGETI